ncbi:stage II sporulation protein D [Bacillus songklensis]|uniref:Stage II sporulation protein D n=1 Tax=Bacillus songklensis TaxID=1069116 RepID=A0ABV8BAI1_9BACI
MKHVKPIVVLVSSLFVMILLIPTLLVIPFADKTSGQLGEELRTAEAKTEAPSGPTVEVAVYRTKTKQIEKVPLEDYVLGVVAAEMPAEFELEALKAQSLAARTYIVKQLLSNSDPSVPKGANVTDTVLHQVYYNEEDLKKVWGRDYEWKIEKVRKAVSETNGKILTYENTPITAAFFSTSNGYTENSEAYWPNSVPYLKSVASPWDKQSPKYFDQMVIDVHDFEKKLGVRLSGNGTLGKVVARTPGKRIELVSINGKELSGKEIREKLDLRSTDFTWERKGSQIIITTKGYGHGIGMSQYGANGMATEGKNYQDIVTYYYQGATVSSYDPFLSKLTAKK